MKTLILIIATFLASLVLSAQNFNQAKMDSLFTRIEKNQKSMCSVSIFKNGEEVYHRSIGFADIEHQQKANRNTKYRIGSISKMFTAVLIMQLVEEGKLSLYTELSKFYPKIPNAEEISIENLLRHHSGIFDLTHDPAYLQYAESPKTKAELLGIFQLQESVFEPGTTAEYSNTNYILLTFIIEDIIGKDFSEILKERIAEPLGLENTYYGGKIEPANNEAFSYVKEESWGLSEETDMSIPQGAGGLVSTPTDLNRFLIALFKGKLVDDSTLETMMTIKDGFGIGMMQFPFYSKTVFGHGGSIDGFDAMAGYFPAENMSMSIVSNASEMGLNDISIGVLSIYFGKDYELPVFEEYPEYKVSAETLKQYLGVYGTTAMPLKITITQNESGLLAEATGQGIIPLKAYAEHKFKFGPAGVKMEFIPEENKMILLQGGGKFEFLRE